MLRIGIRSVLAHKLRFLLTTLAVVTGVAFVVGAFVVTDSLRASVGDLFANISSGVDVSVRASTPIEGGSTIGVSRGRVPESLVDVVRKVEGVAVAEGTVSGYAQLLDKQGHPLKTTGAPFLGVSWGKEDAALSGQARRWTQACRSQRGRHRPCVRHRRRLLRR